MNYFIFLSLIFFGTVKCQKDSQPAFKVITKLGYFNATFTWKIEHFQLHNFGQRYDAKPLTSPILKAVDYSDGNKVYTAKFIIQPYFYFTNEILSYTIKTNFSQNPRKAKYFYAINSNQTFKGIKISRVQLSDVLDTIEISVYAIFSNRKKQTEFVPPQISIPMFSYENQSTLSNEILKLYQNDPDSQFVIECNNESITAYKTVMQARSPIFGQLLSNGTNIIDGTNITIEIDEYEPKIISKMIEFCNFDSIKDFENDELQIFAVANSYQIQSLMIYAAREIVKTATVKNAIERYVFAVSQNSWILEKWFLNFIITNFLEVSNTPNFDKLDAKTYKILLEELLKKNKIN